MPEKQGGQRHQEGGPRLAQAGQVHGAQGPLEKAGPWGDFHESFNTNVAQGLIFKGVEFQEVHGPLTPALWD